MVTKADNILARYVRRRRRLTSVLRVAARDSLLAPRSFLPKSSFHPSVEGMGNRTINPRHMTRARTRSLCSLQLGPKKLGLAFSSQQECVNRVRALVVPMPCARIARACGRTRVQHHSNSKRPSVCPTVRPPTLCMPCSFRYRQEEGQEGGREEGEGEEFAVWRSTSA